MRYIMTAYYKSHVGEYQAGTVLDIADADFAAWLTRDSMGALQPIVDAPPAPVVERASDKPQHDRQMKTPKNKRGHV
jgi:hypothetical protein